MLVPAQPVKACGLAQRAGALLHVGLEGGELGTHLLGLGNQGLNAPFARGRFDELELGTRLFNSLAATLREQHPGE